LNIALIMAVCWPLQIGADHRHDLRDPLSLGPGAVASKAWKIPSLVRIGAKQRGSRPRKEQFLLKRLLPSQVAIVLHPGESWFPTPVSMFCLGWSRPDEWLQPILDEFQNELPVNDLEATRL
jgi:hypothetical protein